MASRPATHGAAALLLLACALAFGLAAQDRGVPSQVPTVKGVAATLIQSVDGKDSFDAYCAACHGVDGRGHGPAAPAMKSALPDLTTMAERNHGEFDALKVEYIIRGKDRTTPAHVVEDMPVWGKVFQSEDPARSLLRIRNLVTYIQGLQAGT